MFESWTAWFLCSNDSGIRISYQYVAHFTLVFGLPIDLALKASFLILKAKKAKFLQVIGAFFAVELIETAQET